MHAQWLHHGIIASGFLLSVLAVPSPERLEIQPVEESFFEGDPLEGAFEDDGLPDGAELAPHGYLVPAHISPEDYDLSAPWMVPVKPVNGDTNETIFDDEGYDLTARSLSEDDSDPSGLERRASWTFGLGRNTCDMGCGATIAGIRNSLGEAVYALCKSSVCDAGAGTKYVREIVWMDNGSSRVKRYIEITAQGTYTGPHTLGNMHNAVKASVQSGSVQFAWRSTYIRIADYTVRCKMAKFPNYIVMNKPAPNQINNVMFWINLRTVESSCLAGDVMSTIAGAINAVAGVAFGLVAMMCR